MNDQNSHDQPEQALSAVLTALGSARPSDGLDQRVLRRLAEADLRPLSRGAVLLTWLRSRRVAAAGLAACAVCVALILFHVTGGHADQPMKSVWHEPSLSQAGAALPVSTIHPTQDAKVSMQPAPPASARNRRISTDRPRSAPDKSPDIAVGVREPSYPAPADPLTEQEQLLLRIAHRDDPVQVAMLDPVERNLRRTRERAEAARFFAPPALPPELRQQIHAALRSQYVNTPPPDDETLNQMTDRSIP